MIYVLSTLQRHVERYSLAPPKFKVSFGTVHIYCLFKPYVLKDTTRKANSFMKDA